MLPILTKLNFQLGFRLWEECLLSEQPYSNSRMFCEPNELKKMERTWTCAFHIVHSVPHTENRMGIHVHSHMNFGCTNTILSYISMFSASLTAKNITFYVECNHAMRVNVDGVCRETFRGILHTNTNLWNETITRLYAANFKRTIDKVVQFNEK